MSGRLLYIHAISAIHSGTGQGIGDIDQPIARDPTTNWPILPGSSLKGILRARATTWSGSDPARLDLTNATFGPDTQNAHKFAGALTFGDAHIVALPIRSLYGTFAWVTCPLVLHHWQRDRVGIGDQAEPLGNVTPTGDLGALTTSKSQIRSGATVYLERYDLDATASPEADTVARSIADAAFTDDTWKAIFRERFAIVSDFVFNQLADLSLEVTARIRLNDESKTVARGGLWYEEVVPAETIFAAPLLAGDVRVDKVHQKPHVTLANMWAQLEDATAATLLQIGGNASVGKGLIEVALAPMASTAGAGNGGTA